MQMGEAMTRNSGSKRRWVVAGAFVRASVARRSTGAAGMLVTVLHLTAIAVAAQAPVAASRSSNLAYVSNEVSRDISIVDLDALRVVGTVPVEHRPRGIQLAPGGRRVLVALSDDRPHTQTAGDAIVEIDVVTRRIVARHNAGGDPEQFGITPDGARLYAANEDAGTASGMELRTGKVLATLVVGIEPEGVAVSPDGRWVYVTAETSNSVSVIDVKTNRVVANLLVDVRPRAVAFSPDGRRAYVTAEIGGTVTAIDTRTHEIVAVTELEGAEGKPVGVVVSPDGRRVYVANGAAGRLSIIDAASLEVVASVPVGRRPWGVAVSRDGKRVYTANGLTNDISVVDVDARRVIATIAVGQRPWGIALSR